jgi:sugar/nucleoside kinase (ribokinase family)
MRYAGDSKVSYVQEPISVAIVSANDIATMLQHAREIKEKDVKLVMDPAQQISQMSKQELRECIHLADILILNHIEYADLQSKSTLTEEDLRSTLDAIIVTYGAQ